ncbi:unnamed protein product [Mytilus edulis]|uniref:Uncharacterized protein n=1 Tax=Mytilus edulis TaxID=6550 RepID=A0A8S3RES1_MYTED|nr:unnamed protein product [Mytilus edulis]
MFLKGLLASNTDLKDTKSVEFTRLLNNDGLSPQTARLHIFTDASKQAYGACAYIVQGKHSQLVMAKNRVAPLKVITLPRLELMGAVVGAKLAKHVSNILGITEITFWCDSQIVLSWLYSSKIQKPFIANRITPPLDRGSIHHFPSFVRGPPGNLFYDLFIYLLKGFNQVLGRGENLVSRVKVSCSHHPTC